MALTYLQMVNRVLVRIGQAVISDVTAATGHAKMIADYLNQAQNELWTETTNWYTLFKQRRISSYSYTAATLTFNASTPATIQNSVNGFTNFVGNTGITIKISGSASNDGVYMLHPTTVPAVALLTLASQETLVAESAGSTVSIIPITYPLATDWGRTLDIVDLTNNRTLTEDVGRAFDEANPQMDSTNIPTHFSIQGNFYRFFYPVTSVVQLVDRYWKMPTTLTTSSQTSDFPQFCENFLIEWSYMKMLEYMNKFELADRVRASLYTRPGMPNKGILEKAMIANNKIIDKILRFRGQGPILGIEPPRFPWNYGARYY